MRHLLIFVLLIANSAAFTQINVPKGFKLVKGESPAGRDDYFTDGKYMLFTGTPFQADTPPTDAGKIMLLFEEYGISFHKTKDGLFYGTGLSRNKFRYIIIANGLSYVLAANNNDSDFSKYSVWLLAAIRNAIRGGNELYFK